ncbi:MAG: ROK family protein [Rhodospirillaceae bacterium]|nr:ROK family protein [Rhodospirillaceae bacterium]
MSETPSGIRIGIDLGGTKIEAIALARDGRALFRQRIPTPVGDYAATVRAVADLARAAGAATQSPGSGTPSVGVGIPGATSPATGLVKNANSVCLIGHPLERDLSAALGQSVRLANDADCFALSEAADGAGDGADIVFGIILGTGVGGGLVINKQVVRGPNAITGEWGHNPLPWPRAEELPGPKCYCGLSGCIETFLCGGALARDYAEHSGLSLSAGEIASAHGDAAAVAALERYINRLARATATVINIIDPHVIVLGGGLSKIPQLYEAVPALWPDYVLSDTIATRLVPPRHGDSSGVRGAAWLWP